MIAMMANKRDISRIGKLPFVNSIGYNDTVQCFDRPTYGLAKSFWIGTEESRKIIGADIAEQNGITGRGVKVAVLDTGVYAWHPQLIRRGVVDINAIMAGPPEGAPPPPPFLADFFKPSSFQGAGAGFDDNGHATHCVTTVGGEAFTGPENIKVKGVAPDFDLIAIKVLGTPMGIGMNSDIIRGIDIALAKGADVISMSLGSDQGDNNTPACLAIRMAMAAYPQVVFVIAAGNFGPDASSMGSPACSLEALTVGSMSILDQGVSYFSSRGPTEDSLVKPDVLGPGGGRFIAPEDGEGDEFIYSGTSPGTVLDVSQDGKTDGFTGLQGTSMATPHIAGLVALLKQKYQGITTEYIKAVMAAKQPYKTPDSGWGLMTYQDFVKE
jgi:subtilisin family serine protease